MPEGAVHAGAAHRREMASEHQALGHAAIVGLSRVGHTPERWARGLAVGSAPRLDAHEPRRHAAVLWRFRAVTVAGVLLGLVLAVLASYKVTFRRPDAARVPSTYNSESAILVTQAGLPGGPRELPTPRSLGGGRTDAGHRGRPPDRIEFADPGRFIALADLYAQLLDSATRSAQRIPRSRQPTQITATPLAGHLRLPDPADHPADDHRARGAGREGAQQGRRSRRCAGSSRSSRPTPSIAPGTAHPARRRSRRPPGPAASPARRAPARSSRCCSPSSAPIAVTHLLAALRDASREAGPRSRRRAPTGVRRRDSRDAAAEPASG